MDSKKKMHVDEIRKVHKDLRKEFRKDADFSKVWEAHCNDEEALAKYARSMQDLALDIWDEDCDGKHRIKWCRDKCEEYFHNGGLKRLLDKDQRRQLHFEKDGSDFIQGPSPLRSLAESEQKPGCRSCDADGKLQLLDVGSCYDPFGEFEEFETTAIDLNPANENVWKCDFIKVNISSDEEYCVAFKNRVRGTRVIEVQMKDFDEDKDFQNCSKSHPQQRESCEHYAESHGKSANAEKHQKKGSEITSLPPSYFNVVVFSLVLTYIPCPRVRWEMCQKSHKLLQANGILLIITPDSSHQNRNAALMKKWKTAIEVIGFQRIEYQKDTHLHFMAFRKVPSDFLWDKRKVDAMLTEGVTREDLCLNIPQDFQEYEDSDPEHEFDEAFALQGINELPCI